ncbi:MAG: 50S ribosomal protein L13 [Patescibacteria group bacterium]
MKTVQPKIKEVKRSWHLIDANGEVLGRLSSRISRLLLGKNKVYYAPFLDVGDFVVVTNAEKVVLTGKKSTNKVYRGHSGYPGGFKEVSFKSMLEKHPDRILRHAISGMLPDNKLKKGRLRRLKIVVGKENPYAANISEYEKI